MKKVLVVSDIHAGSKVSLMPPTVTEEDGTKHIHNPIQEKIYNKWVEMCDDVGKVDLCVVLGDSCDGFNRKSNGLGMWTTDLKLQADTAVNLLKMINTKKYYGVQGSFYHVGENMSSDAYVIDKLNGTFDDDMIIDIEKTRCYFRHWVSSTSSVWMYKPTKVAREMILAHANMEQYGKINIFGFGHVHNFVGVEYGHTYGFTAPCWKGRDGFAKRGTFGWTPQFGYVVLDIHGSDFNIEKHLFSLKGKDLIKEAKI